MSLVLNVEILGEFKKLTSASKGAQTELQGLNKKISGFASSAGKAFASIGAGLTFAFIARELTEATKAAIDDRKSQELLADQLVKTTKATESEIAAVEKSIAALQSKAGIADDELRPAMAQLVRVTKDSTEATKLLDLATDISAGSGKSLTSVVAALSKAYDGKFAALTKLGVPMSDSIRNASDYSAAMQKLTKLQADAAFATEQYGVKSKEAAEANKKVAEQQEKTNAIVAAGIDWQNDLRDAFGGAAEKAANLDPYKKMQIMFGDIQEQIGAELLPVLDEFVTWLNTDHGKKFIQDVVDIVKNLLTGFKDVALWVMENKDWLLPLVQGLGAVTVAWKAVTTAVTATRSAIALATAAQLAFNAAASGGVGGVGGKGGKVPSTSKVGLPLLGGAAALTAGAVLAIPGSTDLSKIGEQLLPQYDASGRLISYKNSKTGEVTPVPVGTGQGVGVLAPGNNVTININQGTTTGSDIISRIKSFGNSTGVKYGY